MLASDYHLIHEDYLDGMFKYLIYKKNTGTYSALSHNKKFLEKIRKILLLKE